MGFTCKVVRGFSAFAPCLEHVRAGGGSVANALFHVYVGVGDCALHLDHSVLVRSDICHLGCHGGTCGITCGIHDIRRHHVFRLGCLIGLRSVAWFGRRDVCKPDSILGELSYSFWTRRTILCVYDY